MRKQLIHLFSSEDEGDTECLTLYVLQIPVQNRWGMIQMSMKLWPLIFM
ncbi:colicin [Escherichia coli]|nr:colicin [Escherichia coli]EFO0396869.1 colicin [Escherichia coli]MLN77439.1 colicin [Escherichia coli]